MKCPVCNKRIWFWQKYESEIGAESFDYGFWIKYYHIDCF